MTGPRPDELGIPGLRPARVGAPISSAPLARDRPLRPSVNARRSRRPPAGPPGRHRARRSSGNRRRPVRCEPAWQLTLSGKGRLVNRLRRAGARERGRSGHRVILTGILTGERRPPRRQAEHHGPTTDPRHRLADRQDQLGQGREQDPVPVRGPASSAAEVDVALESLSPDAIAGETFMCAPCRRVAPEGAIRLDLDPTSWGSPA